MEKQKLDFLTAKARKLRDDAIEIIGHFGVGHIGGTMSVMDALTVIYYDKANVDPKNPKKQDRDRVIMSKGHAGPAMYAVLGDLGFYPHEWESTLNRNGTNLPSHCDMNKTPGIDFTAGSLGQGLSAAVGMALTAKWTIIPQRFTASSATVNRRKVRSGKRRCLRATTALTISSCSLTTTKCNLTAPPIQSTRLHPQRTSGRLSTSLPKKSTGMTLSLSPTQSTRQKRKRANPA